MTSSDSLTLGPIRRITGSIHLPGSKSLSNRVLLLSMLTEGTTHIRNLLDSDDVRFMVRALQQLGILMLWVLLWEHLMLMFLMMEVFHG